MIVAIELGVNSGVSLLVLLVVILSAISIEALVLLLRAE